MGMAAIGIGLACRSQLLFRRPHVFRVRKVQYSSSSVVSVVESLPRVNIEFPETSAAAVNGGGCKEYQLSGWKKLRSKDLGISTSMISKPTKSVLKALKSKGYEVYLVGGCVRDLILKKIPKDFDVITSAELKEVVRTFPRCGIVGRRFPICHVHVADTIVEVSSFSIVGKQSRKNLDIISRKPPGLKKTDYIRWKNCAQRDFTINGLMFDPFTEIVYDYVGGVDDIRKAKVRTLIPAGSSFTEDCARILRGVRIAARLGFGFTKEISRSLKELSRSVLRLDKGRILMEMNYMLAYGSSEASMRLLWKFGLLELLLPLQASYFVSQGFRRRDKRSNMLLSMFAKLDGLLAPDRPCHSSLWVSILAFHQALADQPRDPVVVAAFCLAIHNGGSLMESVRIAKRISQPHDTSFSELLKTNGACTTEFLMGEVNNLAASIELALHRMTDKHFVSQAMAKYPQAPYSDLVFISMVIQERVSKIISCVKAGKEKAFGPKRKNKINYESLALGDSREVRHILARIIFDTVYPPNFHKNEISVNRSAADVDK